MSGASDDESARSSFAAGWPALLSRRFDIGSLVALRHEVERCGESAGLDDLVLYRFVVAVNEITTNAVRHGGGGGRLKLWRVGDRLHCTVTDRGPGMSTDLAALREPPAYITSGRGLWLARHGCTTVSVASGATGTTVTLTVISPPVEVGHAG